jgi:hypothetical protein
MLRAQRHNRAAPSLNSDIIDLVDPDEVEE